MIMDVEREKVFAEFLIITVSNCRPEIFLAP